MATTRSRGSRAGRGPRASARADLATYRAKRDFRRTPEPAGAPADPQPAAGLRFVVQKHAARSLHYDFRLELDGVLLSWAVPKGPSDTPGERRLAVRTEDHPLAYADFEGEIPKGEYGAGEVVIWDRGTWLPEGDAHAGLRKGHLVFTLRGERLRGRWHLVRTRLAAGKGESWLLFKGRDDPARATDAPAERESSAHASELLAHVRALPLGFPLTNLEKVLYPEQGLRKAELVAYYAAIAPRMLPYVAGRPLTLVRCPDGRQAGCFFQKHASDGVPDAVARVRIPEERGAPRTYMTVSDMPGLVALAQLGALEIHTWGCRADAVEKPDQLVFDLDPDAGLGFERVVEAALAVRARLSDLGLRSFVKTTGGKGLHVVAPVARRGDWDAHKAFARAVVETIARDDPDRYTIRARKAERGGRTFLDYLRNARGATAVAPYSTRAREGATVAAPITWQELEGGLRPAELTVLSLPQRLEALRRDPWQGYASLRQGITATACRALGLR
ncbi:MAG TPA: non-homologous end-joining DNA ligase [Myxococcota bacterium]|nr:non-homologous end-joining DNA ligase [Myxococcota bacterium]